MNQQLKYSFIQNEGYKNKQKILKDTYKVKEYELWYKGNINELLAFYKQGMDHRNRREAMTGKDIYNTHESFTPSFYKLVPTGNDNNIGGYNQLNNFTVYHNPVANVISRAKSDLIASTAPIITVSLPNQVRETERLQALIEEIAEANEYDVSLQQEVEYASFSGGITYKPILDPEFSELPLYQTYHKGQFFLNKKYDKTLSVVFIDEYETDENTYTLYSEHGRGYVNYVLVDKNNEVVPLNTIPEISDLKPIQFKDKDGNDIKDLMAVYVENKPGFRSDYENSIDDFMALDENYSKMMDFLRKTTATRVVSESVLKMTQDGHPIVPSVYDSNFLIKWDNTSGEVDPVNELQALPDVNNPIQGYARAMDQIYHQISTVSGLSVKTLSGQDMGGANESAEALIIRENQDLRTRENMIVVYNNALKKLYKLLLMLTDMEVIGDTVIVNPYNDLQINIEFYNPASPTFSQIAEEVSFLLDNGLIDNYGALERLWIDTGRKTKEEVEKMLQAIEGNRSQVMDFIQSEADKIMEEEDEEDILNEDEEEEEDIDGDK